MERRPFINASMLENHIGTVVSAIGKVTGVNSSGNQIKIQMDNGGEVTVALQNELTETLEGIVAITAEVENANSLTAHQIFSFGSTEVDFNLYDEAVKLSSRYPELFSNGLLVGPASNLLPANSIRI